MRSVEVNRHAAVIASGAPGFASPGQPSRVAGKLGIKKSVQGRTALKTPIVTAAALAILSLGPAWAAAPSFVTTALGDASRPAADKARDAERKAEQVVVLTGVKPGDKVADVFPGSGYYTRIFAKIVGPKGHVYGFLPTEAASKPYKPADAVKALAAEPGYGNVSALVQDTKAMDAGGLDLIFISQFYHDMHNATYGGPDIVPQNKGLFNALKPGGVLFIIDHSAPGTGISATNTTHRIDAEAVKTELTAAGFKLEAQSDVLKNPADPHDANVFNPSIRGKTDQFILKFRKPK
jgi:predicted methyltransferase